MVNSKSMRGYRGMVASAVRDAREDTNDPRRIARLQRDVAAYRDGIRGQNVAAKKARKAQRAARRRSR